MRALLATLLAVDAAVGVAVAVRVSSVDRALPRSESCYVLATPVMSGARNWVHEELPVCIDGPSRIDPGVVHAVEELKDRWAGMPRDATSLRANFEMGPGPRRSGHPRCGGFDSSFRGVADVPPRHHRAPTGYTLATMAIFWLGMAIGVPTIIILIAAASWGPRRRAMARIGRL